MSRSRPWLRSQGRPRRGILLWLVAGLLGGCAAVRDAPAPAPVTAEDIAIREQRLGELDRFLVSGGFGYRDDRQNLSASIEWRRDGELLAIRLRAPLGLGRLDVTQDGQGARLVRSGRAPVAGPDVAALLRSELGLGAPVPLHEIDDWIRGLPGSAASQVQRDARGRLQRLDYRDATGQRWRATVGRYRQVDGLWLPGLLTAVSGERSLRLALSDWQLDPERVPAGPVSGQPAPATPSRRLPLPGA